MKTKRGFSTELAYVLGIVFLAIGTAFMERADFGVSMVVAPAYLLHLHFSQTYSFFTFGMAEYVLQAFVLIFLCLVMRKAKISYLFSFITAVFYGLTLDLCMALVSDFWMAGLAGRLVNYILGIILCSLGVSLLFHTYIAPEAYELFVKEISFGYGFKIDRVKTVYDICSCLVGVVLSFIFFGFGHFEGVKAGTIICALINGWIIGRISALLEHCFDFKDSFSLRPLFDR
ncbi:MAG: DUF6198 family protein [Sphaerochaetaceae bacterium]|nr:DUF6198 family protein [Sphaerochaetaceae bacterium]